eukprot:756614-Hanusia_phi.AAC.3
MIRSWRHHWGGGLIRPVISNLIPGTESCHENWGTAGSDDTSRSVVVYPPALPRLYPRWFWPGGLFKFLEGGGWGSVSFRVGFIQAGVCTSCASQCTISQ